MSHHLFLPFNPLNDAYTVISLCIFILLFHCNPSLLVCQDVDHIQLQMNSTKPIIVAKITRVPVSKGPGLKEEIGQIGRPSVHLTPAKAQDDS